MLIVDRAVAADPLGGRIQRLLRGLAALPEGLTFAPADRRGRQQSVGDALAARRPVYIVDNLRLSVRVAVRHPGARVVLDVGDDAASLASTKGRPRAEVAALYTAQRLVESRTRGLVVRGLGHAGAVASRPGSPPICLVPDACVPPAGWEPKPRTGAALTLGFVGSSIVSRRAPPSGWELPELLRVLPLCRAVAVVSGSGEAELRRRAAELGVCERLRILGAAPPDRLGEVLDEVDVCLSTQTTNLAGQVRTTGKLVEYLALGKVVVASRAGTAAAVLPPLVTVDRDDVFSPAYVREVAERIETLAAIADEEYAGLQRYNRALAVNVFSAPALAPLWLKKMEEWEMLPA